MIKHSLKDDLIHVSIDNIDFSYRIPVKKLGNTIDWKMGEKGTNGILIKNVSKWSLQFFTKKALEEKYVIEFKNIVQEYAPTNTINWEETFTAIKIQNEYNSLAENKLSDAEIITTLKTKYKLD